MNSDRVFSIVVLIACVAALGWRFGSRINMAVTPPPANPDPVAVIQPGLLINETINPGIPMSRVWSDYGRSPSLLPWATQRSKVNAGC